MAARFASGLSPLIILIGCATIEEPDLEPAVDGGFVVINEDGSVALPGSGGFGGTPAATGGQGGDSLPPPGTGGATEPSGNGECPPGTKICGGLCVSPAPKIGCDTTGCTACPDPPANADAVCSGTDCSFTCRPGYVSTSGACTMPSTGAGGATGTGGTFTIPSGGSAGSSTGSCNAASCTGCSVAGPIGCCTSAGRCGCTWAPGAYCL